jgi:lipoprotein-releasing system ATP-binding protein
MNSIISCKNIYKTFGKIEVLKGIDLSITKSEIVSIVGPSGSGKTTLLQILGTLENPDNKRKPELLIDNQSIMKLSDNKKSILRNKKLGFVFQFHELLPEFTAIENVCLPSWISKNDMDSTREEAIKILDEFDLLKVANKKPDEMSGGERQRVSVARSLINNPKIVFADEPSGNLDSENSKNLYSLFYELRKNKGCSFVIVTHDLKFANMSDRKIVLNDGKIIK